MIIDQLPSVGTPALTDETVTEQGQNLFKVTWQRLLALFKGNTTLSELSNDAGFINASQASAAAPVQSVNGQTGAVTTPVTPLSDASPSPLGTASAGTSTDASRADHVHAMPTADDVGAMKPLKSKTLIATLSNNGSQSITATLADYDSIYAVFLRPAGGTGATAMCDLNSLSSSDENQLNAYPGTRAYIRITNVTSGGFTATFSTSSEAYTNQVKVYLV